MSIRRIGAHPRAIEVQRSLLKGVGGRFVSVRGSAPTDLEWVVSGPRKRLRPCSTTLRTPRRQFGASTLLISNPSKSASSRPIPDNRYSRYLKRPSDHEGTGRRRQSRSSSWEHSREWSRTSDRPYIDCCTGLGRAIATGWFIAAVTGAGAVAGAAAGALAGILTDVAIAAEDAEGYTEGVRRAAPLLWCAPMRRMWSWWSKSWTRNAQSTWMSAWRFGAMKVGSDAA